MSAAALAPDRSAARATVAAEIERLIDILDLIDGDADLEPETDTGVDDVGEPRDASWIGTGSLAIWGA